MLSIGWSGGRCFEIGLAAIGFEMEVRLAAAVGCGLDGIGGLVHKGLGVLALFQAWSK